MTDNAKISPEQLLKLQELQDQFDKITKQYGELRFQQLLTQDQMDQLSAAMRSLDTDRNAMVVAIQEKFGSAGAVNLQTGEFIPD